MPQTIFCIAFIIFTIVAIFAGPKIRQHREHAKDMKLINEVFNDAMYEELKDSIAEFFVTRGYTPSIEELNQITKRLMSYFEKDLPRQVLVEKLISFIPNITPSFLDFKSYMNLNIVRLIKRYVPNRWFDKISIASLTYCNLTEKDMHSIMALQKADIRPEEMSLYRFNYEQCAYAILYNTVLNIEPMSDDFTEEVRKDILQKILAGAEEEGYNLKDDYKNND